MHHGMLHVDRKNNDDQVQWFCGANLDAHVLRGARRQSEGSGARFRMDDAGCGQRADVPALGCRWRVVRLRGVVSPLHVARSAGRLARGARSVRSRNGHARVVPGQVEVFEQLRQLGVR